MRFVAERLLILPHEHDPVAKVGTAADGQLVLTVAADSLQGVLATLDSIEDTIRAVREEVHAVLEGRHNG